MYQLTMFKGLDVPIY